jgi:hypothetical protein
MTVFALMTPVLNSFSQESKPVLITTSFFKFTLITICNRIIKTYKNTTKVTL